VKQRASKWQAASLNNSTTLKMEAIRSSETSGTTQRITRRHIPEEDTLQNHRCENLKSYKDKQQFKEMSTMFTARF
jgi:hypothetical protein